MRLRIMMRITALMVFLIAFLSGPGDAAAAKENILDRDTSLPIQLKRVNVLFARGTRVYLNDNNEVRKGTLAKDTALAAPGLENPLMFRKNSQVEFSMMGLVQQGIMVSDAVLKIDGSKKPIKIRGGLPVYFGMTGLSAGTLAESTTLPNPRKKLAEELFPAGTYVMFTMMGQVYIITPPK